jgi:integrase
MSDLSKDLVRGYKRLVLEKAVRDGDTQAETARRQRTANSTLRQARSIFSKEMLEHYQVNCGLKFNLTHLEEFRTTPGFLGLRRTPYNQPQDSQVSKMIAALDQISSSDPDVYLICWLGLTFGLRKSEVAPLTSDCFVRLDGEVYVEIRTVEGRGSLRDTTKNGQEVPRVKAANGGWSKIGPIVERIPRGRYLIGGSDTYRTDGIFRRVNDWLTSQGWRTQKKFHELRAFAGSRVIMNDGIEAASSWLRHGSISLTQAHYGRYAKSVVRDIPLKLQNPVEGVSNAAALDTPLDTPKWNTDRASEGLSKWNLSTLSGGQQPDQTVEDKGFSYAIAYR